MQIEFLCVYNRLLIELLKRELRAQFFAAVRQYQISLCAYNNAHIHASQQVGFSVDDLSYLEFSLDETDDAEELSRLREAQAAVDAEVFEPMRAMSEAFDQAKECIDALVGSISEKAEKYLRHLLVHSHLLVEAPEMVRLQLILQLRQMRPAIF